MTGEAGPPSTSLNVAGPREVLTGDLVTHPDEVLRERAADVARSDNSDSHGFSPFSGYAQAQRVASSR